MNTLKDVFIRCQHNDACARKFQFQNINEKLYSPFKVNHWRKFLISRDVALDIDAIEFKYIYI